VHWQKRPDQDGKVNVILPYTQQEIEKGWSELLLDEAGST
jgi:hypothetical protein